MRSPIIDRSADPIFVDVTNEGHVELRIGKPVQARFETMEGASPWVVPRLLERSASLPAFLTPEEARIVAHALLAAADMASASN